MFVCGENVLEGREQLELQIGWEERVMGLESVRGSRTTGGQDGH